MKKFGSFALATAMTAQLMAGTAFAASTCTATHDVYMREGASKQSEIVTVVPNKAKVSVTDTSNKYWYKVQYTNSKGKKFSGYVCTAYLSTGNTSTATTSTTATAEKGDYTATTDVNLRDKGSNKGKVLVVVPKNATVKVTDTSSHWYKVSYTNKSGKEVTGYIYSKYLKAGSASTSSTATTSTTSTAETGDYTATTAVNLREKGSNSAKVLTVVPKNAKVKVTDTSSYWYKVEYTNSKGKTVKGYIGSRYLKKA